MAAAARFYKSDLQMQTPVDSTNWRGLERVNQQTSADERQTVATAYIRRCYEVGLEIIGVTDHNLNPPSCPSLIPELRSAAAALASTFGYEIAILPGFEVAVPIGGGVHVMCLFEPETSIEKVSEKLTTLGLPTDKRFVSGTPAPISQDSGFTLDKLLHVVQDDPDTPGLVVMAHAVGNSGILDSKTIAKWWAESVIMENRVLCVELPKSREDYLSGQSSLIKSILQNDDTRFQRDHPIASIMSSDCKALVKSDHENNYIGFRHTWLKMGTPTIEGLRQAFLDHESRVKFGDLRPEDGYTYPRLTSLSIEGATFLDDQVLNFSHNLNVIIGGSGTGKSTVAQYLRMLFDQASSIRGGDVQANYTRCLQTIRPSTRLSVGVVLDGQLASVSTTGSTPGTVTAPGSEIDGKAVAGVFPVRFFGQREIYNIAEDRAATVALLDDLDRSRLSALDRKVHELQTRYREAATAAQAVAPLKKELEEVAADLASKQVKVRRIEAEAAPFQALAAANLRLQMADELLEEGALSGAALLETRAVAKSEAPTLELADDDQLNSLRQSVAAAQAVLDAKVGAAVHEFQQAIDQLVNGELLRSLRQQAARLKEETAPVLADLAEKGIDLDQYESYRTEVRGLKGEVETIGQRMTVAEASEESRIQLLAEIRDLWGEELAIRLESAKSLNVAVPRTRVGSPFVEVSVEPFGDDRAFRRVLDGYRGDRRMISDDDWSALADAVSTAATDASPTQTLAEWVRQLRRGDDVAALAIRDSRHRQRVLDCFPESTLHELEIGRIPDRVRVLLRREDGSEAGDIEGGLSVGQKCTAVLALLLALDITPVVIDQPEDDIDNEFTFSEIVPLLRKVKEQRQLIIVTHDPNIPVNADAEMIHALAAVDGKGRIKVVDGEPAVGSLDQTQVRVAVEEIMEGSETAFRRRFVKYGF